MPTNSAVSIRHSALGEENTLSVVGTFGAGVFVFSPEGGVLRTVGAPTAATLGTDEVLTPAELDEIDP